MRFDAPAAIAQIDKLIQEVEPRIETSDGLYGHYFKSSDIEARAMRTRLVATIERLAPRNSAYIEQAREAEEQGDADERKVVWLAGILTALRHDYEAGYLQRVEELVHADVFADFLEMADELLSKDYKDAAAVIVGSVLEEHLRKLTLKFGLSLQGPTGAPTKADTLNADLVKAGAYDKLEQKGVTYWLGLRNKAAHGEYDGYDKSQVEALVRDVRSFMARHRA